MILAGIDTATTSGFAVLDGERLLCAYAFEAKGETEGELFASFRSWLYEMLYEYKVEHIGIEEPLPTNRGEANYLLKSKNIFGGENSSTKKRPVSSMATFLRLYGLRAIAMEVAHSLKIPITEVNIREWRGGIFGVRSAPKGVKDATGWWKEKALERCRQLGWPTFSKDAAEACAIADYMRARLNPRFSGFANELFSRK